MLKFFKCSHVNFGIASLLPNKRPIIIDHQEVCDMMSSKRGMVHKSISSPYLLLQPVWNLVRNG